jgi:Icc-related predicted phosphoesterase
VLTKIAYCSDLHLEFGGMDFDLPDADILILAGDIVTVDAFIPNNLDRYPGVIDFFLAASKKYEKVIWIPGNHEYYGVWLEDAPILVEKYFATHAITNIHYSKQVAFDYNDIRIVGATLWTDMNKGDPSVMFDATRCTNDFRYIQSRKETRKKLTNVQWCDMHDADRQFMIENSMTNKKLIMVSHHSPFVNFQEDRTFNGAYYYGCTDMEDVVYNANPVAYISGHTHTSVDKETEIGTRKIRMLNNPRGYKGHEPIANNFVIKVFEV